jgi:hypothetical protein
METLPIQTLTDPWYGIFLVIIATIARFEFTAAGIKFVSAYIRHHFTLASSQT